MPVKHYYQILKTSCVLHYDACFTELYLLFLSLSFTVSMLKPGETLRDFYKRTNMYWQMAAHEHTQHTGKVWNFFPFIDWISWSLLFKCMFKKKIFKRADWWLIYGKIGTLRPQVASFAEIFVIFGLIGQELRKDGFDLAEARYKELKPILDEVCLTVWAYLWNITCIEFVLTMSSLAMCIAVGCTWNRAKSRRGGWCRNKL